MEVGEMHIGRMRKRVDARAENQHSVDQQQDTDKKPDGYHAFAMHKGSYQKITCRTNQTTVTSAAQKIGRLYIGRFPSDGRTVQPYTKPVNPPTGLGFVM